MDKALVPAAAAVGFEKYSLGHVLWLFGALAAVTIMCASYKKATEKGRRGLKIGAAALGILMQLGRGAALLLRGEYGLSQLPLHLCSISVYLCLVYAFWPKRLLGQFLYAFSLPGWALALLFPGWRGYGLFDPVCVLSFLLHIVPAGFVLMQLFAGELRPEIGLLPGACALMLLLAIPIYIIDINTGQNFMFLNFAPRGTPLALFSFLGRPGYILGMLPMAGLIWAGMYGASLKYRESNGNPSVSPAASHLPLHKGGYKKSAD